MRFQSHKLVRFEALLSIFSVCALGVQAVAADVKSLPAPVFKVGDSWVFDQTLEKGPAGFSQQRLDLKVERLNDSTMVVGIKRDGAPTAYEDHIVGADWSQRHVVDGADTVTTRPFTFPMSVGDSWTVDYIDPIHRGAQTSDHVHRTYKVVGWEDVTVPAGTYHVLKIEADGVDTATIQSPAVAVGGAIVSAGGATSIAHTQRASQGALTRRTYAEFYYAPEVKNYVKSIEEQYTPDDVRVSREMRMMVSYNKPTG